MTAPMRSLKFLPWRSLLQVSALTTVIVVILEFILGLGYKQSDLIRRFLFLLWARPLGLLTTIAVGVGVGALAVYLLELFFKQVFINSASLWALVLCLVVLLILKSLLPVSHFLVRLDEARFLGIVIGVFWKGRPYWR